MVTELTNDFWKHSQPLWAAFMSNMALSPPGAKSREEGRRTVGNCVKTFEMENSMIAGLPTHHGKLAVFDPQADRVVVISHNDSCCEPFGVWEGTVDEYLTTWDCD